MRDRVTSREWRWVLLTSLAVLLFASLPTLYAWSLADAEHVFSGFVYNVEDGNSYLGKMRLGAEGEWLFHIFYTAEKHDPALAFPLHILLGKLAAATELSLALVYHLARVVFGLLLLLTIYAFAARFTPDVTTRRLAWALAAVGSGLGWLLLLLGRSHWLGALPLDFWVPEAYVFLVLYNLPHLALALALLLWALLGSWEIGKLGNWGKGREAKKWLVVGGGSAFLMAWIVPFYAGVLAAALGAYLLALTLARRRLPRREVGAALAVGLGALPAVAYNAWVFTQNPVFRLWSAQNTILSPHPLHYLLGCLPLLIPAVPGAVQAVRRRDERWLLPLAWVLVVPFLLYAPFNLQRRMSAGAWVPLALLAAVGSLAWAGSKPRRRLVLVAWVLVAALSNLVLVGSSLVELRHRDPPAFRPAAEIAAADWLAEHAAPDDLVLTAYESGNLLPARARVRVFLGHGPETLYHSEKVAAVQRFFDSATDDAWRQDLLAEYGIIYVFYGPAERALGDWDPASAPYLEAIYAGGAYRVFRVLPGGRP